MIGIVVVVFWVSQICQVCDGYWLFLEFFDMLLCQSVEDICLVVWCMVECGVVLIVVFGGDGMYKVVVVEVGDVFLLVLFIGINNVFLELCEVIGVGFVGGFCVSNWVLLEIGL